MFLKLTDNSKTKFKKNHFNTFGLNFGLPENNGTCPFATQGPGGCLNFKTNKTQVCYMDKLVKARPCVRKSLNHNTKIVKISYPRALQIILATMIQNFIKINNGKDLFFRLHYSGDFFSEAYAKTWAKIIDNFPHVQFWTYTRSFPYVKYFANLKNITLMLSVDPINYEEGLKTYTQFETAPNIGLAWMGNNPPTDRKWITCPETSKKLANTEQQGACSKCRLCIDNYKTKARNINFIIH